MPSTAAEFNAGHKPADILLRHHEQGGALNWLASQRFALERLHLVRMIKLGRLM